MSNALDAKPAVESRSSGIIPVFNPSTEEQIAEVPDSDQATVDAAVARARETFESGVWRKLPAAHRADVLFRAASIIKERTDELAELEARDNGMNVAAAHHIITVAHRHADVLRRLGRQDPRRVEQRRVRRTARRATRTIHNFTQLEPVGVVGLIIPWNGPFFVAMLKAAPALAAGCSCVLKPAEETPLTALKLEEIFREAGLPDGVFNVITGYGETTGAALTAHPDVDKIAFTGSTEVGRLIVKAAAGNLKRLTLELGGKSPLIMFDDANLDKAIMSAGFGPAGRLGAELFLHLAYVRPARHLRPGRGRPRRLREDAADGRQRGPRLGHRAADQREAAPARGRHCAARAFHAARR